MGQALENIKKLEQFLKKSENDGVLEKTLSKIIEREKHKIQNNIKTLQRQISEFEAKYNLTSQVFKQRFENGEIGDDVDFIEWSATLDMISNSNEELNILCA